MTQDVRPVLGGDDGEVDHLDRRPEKVVVQVDPWEPAKANQGQANFHNQDP